MASNFDVNALRPFIGDDGNHYITVNDRSTKSGLRAVPVGNTTATLRKDDWKLLDEAIVKAAKPRLRAVADLRSRGLQFTIPNGMGKTVFETETQSDISDALTSMDGLRESKGDRPVFELGSLPLPIIHKDFSYSARQLMASRNGGSPLDTSTAELAARKVSEEAEKLLLGVSSSFTYGGGTIYGYTNFPSRITAVLTAPTAVGWTPATTVAEVLGMRSDSQGKYHYGPWVLYSSPNWDEYMDADYSTSKGDNTLRERLKGIEMIEDVRTLDYLTDFDLVLVQMTSDVAREIVGMDINTVQWETNGGLQLNYKVMAILVPQLRADQNGNTGIVHGSTA